MPITPFELGVGIALAFMMVDRIMFYINQYKIKNGKKPPHRMPEAQEIGKIVANCVWNDPMGRVVTTEVHDLWQWHNKEDEDGVKVWYVRRSLEEAIKELAENIRVQTTVLQQLLDRD